VSKAVLVLADSSNNCQGREELEALITGASSNMTWALVPPMPKELTPALRGVPLLFHSVSLVLT